MNTPMRKCMSLFTLGAMALALGNFAGAEIPSADGTISACYNKALPGQRVLRAIDTEKGQACRSFERPLSWQQSAPTPTPLVVALDAEEEAFSGLPEFFSRHTIKITTPAAGSVLVNAWTTITPAGLEGFASSRLRDMSTNEVSTIQATTYKAFPSPISVGWVFEVPEGEHEFSLDVALSANITQFTNETMTALFVPAAED